MTAELRQNERLYKNMAIKLTTQFQDSIVANTLNVSDGGLLIACELTPFPQIGDIIKVKSMVFPDAPIKSVIVRRISGAGEIGVEFIYF
jgi:hypothetical protein